MDNLRLDWERAEPVGDQLHVPLVGEMSHAWAHAFLECASMAESEVRGQTWDTVRLGPASVIVSGIEPGTTRDAVRTHVDELVSVANAEAPRRRERAHQDVVDDQRAAREREQAASDLADEFRRSGE
jgi:hypothetical protein